MRFSGKGHWSPNARDPSQGPATRAKDENDLVIYQPNRGEVAHEHRDLVGNRYACADYLTPILQNLTGPAPCTPKPNAAISDCCPGPVAAAVETLAAQRVQWTIAYRQVQALGRSVTQRFAAHARRAAQRDRSRGHRLGMVWSCDGARSCGSQHQRQRSPARPAPDACRC